MYPKGGGNFSCGPLPRRTRSTGEQDKRTVEQIQRGNALTLPLDPKVRRTSTRESVEFLWPIQQVNVAWGGRAIVVIQNGLRVIAIASDERKEGNSFPGVEQFVIAALSQHR